MDLNKAFVDCILEESDKHPSSCLTPMIDDYLECAKRMSSGGDVSSTTKSASVAPSTFGITGANASSSTTSTFLPPTGFGSGSMISGASSSDFNDRFVLNRVVVYKMRPAVDKKGNEIVDTEGKPKMLLQEVGTLTLRVQENKTTGTVVLNLWDNLNPKMSLTLTKGMEFTVVSQTTKKGRVVQLVSFLGLLDANKINEKNKLESTWIRCEDGLDGFLNELEVIGCTIRRM